MNENEEYIVNNIHTYVRSGFYDLEDIFQMIDDILEDDCDEGKLREIAETEFLRKKEDEKKWSGQTDCERLDQVFQKLDEVGIISLQNAGYTMSDGHEDVGEELQARDRSKIIGYCFYHGQDLERAVAGDGLMLAFGDLDAIDENKVKIGKIVVEILNENGFLTEWDQSADKRIFVPKLDWKRRVT